MGLLGIRNLLRRNSVVGDGGVAARTMIAGQGIEARQGARNDLTGGGVLSP